jgi:para-aminobenzoate synthetase component II
MKEVLLIDHFDSFTWNIYHYALQVGIPTVLRREDELTMDAILQLDPAGIIFSPGPGRPKDHPLIFDALEKYASKKPILGICLGHQAIGEFYGAKLIKSDYPTHGKPCIVSHPAHEMFSGIPLNFTVGRYHSLLLSDIPGAQLDVTAFTASGLPMAIAHKILPVWGVQFHPESILSEGGLQLFRNWSSLLAHKTVF